MSARKLPPPKGAAQVVEAAGAVDEANRVRRLSNRYDETGPAAALDWSPSGGSTAAVRPPPPEPATTGQPARPKRARRPEPDGMTRRTYYLPIAAADALDAAVRHVQAAAGGRVDKHVALGALIAAGAAAQDHVAAQVRAEILRELGA